MITPVFGVRALRAPAHSSDASDDKSADKRDDAVGPREKRRHPRLAMPVRCWLKEGDHTVYLRLHDVSLGGVSVRAPVPFGAGAQLSVELELPSGQRVLARANVVWLRQTDEPGGGPRMGASFTEFLSGQDHLQRLLDARAPHVARGR